MATAKLRVVHNDCGEDHDPLAPPPSTTLNRIHHIREQQGVTLRTCARRMKLDMRSLRAQEQPEADLKISQLRKWQEVLEVPLADLVEETDVPLSRPVMERARLVRLMKTVMTISESADKPAIQRLAQTLVEQLCEIMPELRGVASWHSVGQRRTLDELGRTAECQIPTGALISGLLSLGGDDD